MELSPENTPKWAFLKDLENSRQIMRLKKIDEV